MHHQENYNDRLNRVLDYVYAHLEDDLSFDRLADVACLSPYHWSRIYSAMRGETIVATIRRLRLQRAADRLANSDLDIGTVAARAGYGSTDTFGRAFKDTFAVSPAAYRESGSHAAFKAAHAASDASTFPVTVSTCRNAAAPGSTTPVPTWKSTTPWAYSLPSLAPVMHCRPSRP